MSGRWTDVDIQDMQRVMSQLRLSHSYTADTIPVTRPVSVPPYETAEYVSQYQPPHGNQAKSIPSLHNVLEAIAICKRIETLSAKHSIRRFEALFDALVTRVAPGYASSDPLHQALRRFEAQLPSDDNYSEPLLLLLAGHAPNILGTHVTWTLTEHELFLFIDELELEFERAQEEFLKANLRTLKGGTFILEKGWIYRAEGEKIRVAPVSWTPVDRTNPEGYIRRLEQAMLGSDYERYSKATQRPNKPGKRPFLNRFNLRRPTDY